MITPGKPSGPIKKVIVFVAGITVLLLGVILLVFPGPGILLALLGLFILSSEFSWARTVRTVLKGILAKPARSDKR